MTRRRIVYFLALMGCLAFYWAYREWLSWFLLMLIVLLPWFSLLVSLPAMLTCRAQVECPGAVEQNAKAALLWQGRSPFPLPSLTGKMVAENRLWGLTYKLRSGDDLPTDHCGQLTVTLRRPRCHDYLGLFAMPVRKQSGARVLIRPVAIPPEEVPDMSRYQVNMWRPKSGGGFSENHELRLYRPGDSLKQVHWKLSAKTGKLITREPMEPLRNRMLLTMALNGNADRKLGRLLWMSRYLLQCDLPHGIQCVTGTGLRSFEIACPEDITRAVDRLLQDTPAGQAEPAYAPANWRYHIGGDDHG